MDRSLNALPDDALIKPLLITNKAEVKQMFITEYNEAVTMDKFRNEGIDIGFNKGVKKGIRKGIKKGTDIGDRSRMESDARGMYEKGLSPEDIAEIQNVDVVVVRRILGLKG